MEGGNSLIDKEILIKIWQILIGIIFVLVIEVTSIRGAYLTWSKDISRILTFNSVVLGLIIVIGLLVAVFHKLFNSGNRK